MKFIPNTVSSQVARKVLVGQKHSPTILFATGVVGVVASTVLACRATLKLDEVLDETNSRLDDVNSLKHSAYSEEDRKKDKALVYVQSAVSIGKLYGPAIAIGAVSIGCLTGSHYILSKRNAGLVAAYAALEKGFNEYRQRVLEEVGEEKERELRHGVQTYKNKDVEGKQVTRKVAENPSTYAKFFDECSPNWQREPEYNRLFLQAQQKFANDMLKARGHVFLNEIYDSLGLERTRAGAVVGWRITADESDNFIDFGLFNSNNDRAREFINGHEGSILLDFNVDGVIYDKI